MGKVYLMFCTECGMPKRIPITIFRDYIPLTEVTKIYCDNCNHQNYIGGLVKKTILGIVEEKENIEKEEQ